MCPPYVKMSNYTTLNVTVDVRAVATTTSSVAYEEWKHAYAPALVFFTLMAAAFAYHVRKQSSKRNDLILLDVGGSTSALERK